MSNETGSTEIEQNFTKLFNSTLDLLKKISAEKDTDLAHLFSVVDAVASLTDFAENLFSVGKAFSNSDIDKFLSTKERLEEHFTQVSE